MNKTKIAWVRNPDGSPGYTWNPVTGCLRGCPYCYAKKISDRLKGFPVKRKFVEDTDVEQVQNGKMVEYIADKYPPFEQPSLWKSRLLDPILLKKPSTIFVCSMADLFGDWVPDIWINKLFEVVRECKQHTFLFLSKNALRMRNVMDKSLKNVWWGQTLIGAISDEYIYTIPNALHYVSFEPLLGPCIPDLSVLNVKWIIIGSLNQNGKPVHQDNGGTLKEWVLDLLKDADKLQIPVFVKPELYLLYPDLPDKKELPYLYSKACICEARHSK